MSEVARKDRDPKWLQVALCLPWPKAAKFTTDGENMGNHMSMAWFSCFSLTDPQLNYELHEIGYSTPFKIFFTFFFKFFFCQSALYDIHVLLLQL